jgi:hypothetical protein
MKRGTKYVAVTTATLLLLAFLGGIGYWAYTGWLTYHGYCFAQQRYLSDQEKIRMMAERVMRDTNGVVGPIWPMRSNDGKVISDKNGTPVWVLRRVEGRGLVKDGRGRWVLTERPSLDEGPIMPISYRSVDEFLALNPDCCEVQTYYAGSEGRWDFGFWDRFYGYGSGGVIWLSYRSRYRDPAGIEKEISGSYLEIVSNCGDRLTPPF